MPDRDFAETPRDFAGALRDADRAWADETVPPRIERALRQQLRQSPDGDEAAQGRRWLGLSPSRLIGFGTLATAAAALLLWWSSAAQPELGEFATISPCPGFEAHTDAGELIVDRGSCVLREPELGMELSVQTGTHLRRTEQGVAVPEGDVVFDVQPRRQIRRVSVSGGVIEIVGTRFVVHEEGARGWVRLEHGAIRFIAPGHSPVMLKPGERLRWPLDGDGALAANEHGGGSADPAAGADAPDAPQDDSGAADDEPGASDAESSAAESSAAESSAAESSAAESSAAESGKADSDAASGQDPSAQADADGSPTDAAGDGAAAASAKATAARAGSAPPAGSATKVSDRVAWLRARGRFAEAAKLLEQLDKDMSKTDRERLSYERGALLTYRLGDKAAACGHWRSHQASFPGGTYDVEVKRAQLRLKCNTK